MSSFIKTRNSSQCRSHHQKAERKLSSVQAILKNQRKRYKNYQTQFQQMKKILQKLPLQNPLQIQKQGQQIQQAPSIKILQGNLEYRIYRPSLSMIDIKDDKKLQSTRRLIESQKLILQGDQKDIGSECSIQMQDQEKQHSRENLEDKVNVQIGKIDQEQKQDNYEMIQKQQSSQSPHEQSNDQKNDKFRKTADTYTENKNFVRLKKSRSSLPSFDFLSTLGDSDELSKSFNPNVLKKQVSEFGNQKCKTLPAGSQKSESQESWLSQKVYNYQQPIVKSLFSGFISSLQSASKGFQNNQNKILDLQQFTSFNNFCNSNIELQMNRLKNEEVFIQVNKKKKSRKISCQAQEMNLNKILNEIENESSSSKKIKKKWFYCEDIEKGILCHQVQCQDNEDFSIPNQQSIEFYNEQVEKAEQNAQKKSSINCSIFENEIKDLQNQQHFSKKSSNEQEPNQVKIIRNFTKKKSNNYSQASVTKRRQSKLQKSRFTEYKQTEKQEQQKLKWGDNININNDGHIIKKIKSMQEHKHKNPQKQNPQQQYSQKQHNVQPKLEYDSYNNFNQVNNNIYDDNDPYYYQHDGHQKQLQQQQQHQNYNYNQNQQPQFDQFNQFNQFDPYHQSYYHEGNQMTTNNNDNNNNTPTIHRQEQEQYQQQQQHHIGRSSPSPQPYTSSFTPVAMNTSTPMYYYIPSSWYLYPFYQVPQNYAYPYPYPYIFSHQYSLPSPLQNLQLQEFKKFVEFFIYFTSWKVNVMNINYGENGQNG